MAPRVDLTGRKFGRLTVLKQSALPQKGRYIEWMCRCDCGTLKTVIGSHLQNGAVKSCGCLRREKAAETRNRPDVKAKISATLKARRAQTIRRRKYEADPATLAPEDQPTGRKLDVDPAAVADLCKALGFTR